MNAILLITHDMPVRHEDGTVSISRASAVVSAGSLTQPDPTSFWIVCILFDDNLENAGSLSLHWVAGPGVSKIIHTSAVEGKSAAGARAFYVLSKSFEIQDRSELPVGGVRIELRRGDQILSWGYLQP